MIITRTRRQVYASTRKCQFDFMCMKFSNFSGLVRAYLPLYNVHSIKSKIRVGFAVPRRSDLIVCVAADKYSQTPFFSESNLQSKLSCFMLFDLGLLLPRRFFNTMARRMHSPSPPSPRLAKRPRLEYEPLTSEDYKDGIMLAPMVRSGACKYRRVLNITFNLSHPLFYVSAYSFICLETWSTTRMGSRDSRQSHSPCRT